ncbi:hypothetical protein DAEQUDRAFT_729659 [Daedalea quercina L-15889]|uniref:Ribosome assembly protein 3 n=1 Tax=Daedalea quercina L-15889 TaxID=1314783 RepID=A0A165NJW5_9APHY|nr:hypothetical protein DAEQUDRAFT_729659 [Daedalea quercina L-15889]
MVMAPPTKTAVTRKRTRKRKRRAASSSSSEPDSSSSESDTPQTPAAPPTQVKPDASLSEPSSSDSDSSEDDSLPTRDVQQNARPRAASVPPIRRSPTPEPRRAPVPPFPGDAQEEELMRQRFRKFWMASVTDAFSDDLGELRKEPNLTTPRLALLIDSLAAGADVFGSSHSTDEAGINERDVIMGSL